MKILKNLFGKNAKIHVDEIATKVDGVKQLLGFAIISGWGSNTDGNWIKFGNGFMICWHRQLTDGPIAIATGSLWTTKSSTWNFPQQFSESYMPVMFATPSDVKAYSFGAMGAFGTYHDSGTFAILSSEKSEVPIVTGLIAFGRYK